MVGGYYFDKILKDLPAEYIPPSMFCHPEGMAEAITRLAKDKEYRQRLGARAQAFVEQKWMAREVAGRYLKLLQGEIPHEWIFNPENIEYVQGMGQPEARTKAIVRALVERHGRTALFLGDRPALEQHFVDFAFESERAPTAS